jgi:hypothetical protein
MCFIIANNLNVHSFSLKLVIFVKKPFHSKIGLFKKLFSISIKDNLIQNMFKQNILIKFNYIFCFFIIDH